MSKKFIDERFQLKIDSYFTSQKVESVSQNQNKMSQKRKNPVPPRTSKKLKPEIGENSDDEDEIQIILETTSMTRDLKQEIKQEMEKENCCDNQNEVPLTTTDPITEITDLIEVTPSCSTIAGSIQLPSTSKTTFTPRRKLSASKVSLKRSIRKIQQKEVNEDRMYEALKNMNSVKERSTENYEFELEKIYSSKSFERGYADLDTTQTLRYEIRDVVMPRETCAVHLVNIIAEVFSNEINCKYFSKIELDLIYSYLCLKVGSQDAFSKLIVKKKDIYRVKTIDREMIGLEPFIEDLVEHQFLSSDLSTCDIEKLLSLLNTPEIKQLSQTMLTRANISKRKCIFYLQLLAKSPQKYNELRQKVLTMVEPCVYIPKNILSVFDRIFTLFLPTEYPMPKTVDCIFKMMTELEEEKYQFYKLPTARYPVFRNRDHLISFVESQQTLGDAIQARKQKQWAILADLGKLAFEKLKDIVEHTIVDSSQKAVIPKHVKRFYTGNTWGEILWYSVNTQNRTEEGLEVAEKYVRYLLKQSDYAQNFRGQWHRELVLIKFRQKDIENAVRLLLDALKDEGLTDLDRANLIEILKSFDKKSICISAEALRDIALYYKNHDGQVISRNPASIMITGKKESESIQGEGISEIPNKPTNLNLSIANIAVDYYNKQGFNCLLCRSDLPISMFTLFFWEELFTISVPGAFLTSYQKAPLDLYISKFGETKERSDTLIRKKIEKLKAKNHVEFVEHMSEQYTKYKHYKTIFPNIYRNDEQFMGLVDCLGFNVIHIMCEKLMDNFEVWTTDFPDLIVWNLEKKSHKIVEVMKAKGTSNAVKHLWMQYFQQNGICNEQCQVKISAD